MLVRAGPLRPASVESVLSCMCCRVSSLKWQAQRNYPPTRIPARTFFYFESYVPAKVRNVAHNKITLASSTNYLRIRFSLRAAVLDDNADETSASWVYMLLGYMPEMFWGMNFGKHYCLPKKDLPA